jgi:hypothetical protein
MVKAKCIPCDPVDKSISGADDSYIEWINTALSHAVVLTARRYNYGSKASMHDNDIDQDWKYTAKYRLVETGRMRSSDETVIQFQCNQEITPTLAKCLSWNLAH